MDAIPLVRLDNREVWEAVMPRLRELVLSGQFILGQAVQEFEEAAAQTFASPWAVGTSSGMSALQLALRAAPLPPGSKVALPANTFYAVFEAVVAAGHVPVLIDHDPDYVISAELVEPLDVAAVVAVHLYGLPVDMGPLMKLARGRGWWVLEDASQAHGATVGGQPVGSFGDASAFSAYPTKNLGAWGDAGFVTGSDPDLCRRIRSLQNHAQQETNVHEDIGGTDRLDAVQALVLIEKLRRLPEEVAARRRVAGWYHEALGPLGLDLPGDREERRHAYHQFVVRVPRRDELREALERAGIGTGIHYPTPIHLQPGAKGRCLIPTPPKRSETWAGELLSLPMFPKLTQGEVERVSTTLASYLRSV